MNAIFESIEKEKIGLLHFPKADVLQDKDSISQRVSELKRALSLGNLEHGKTKIFSRTASLKKSSRPPFGA